MTENNQDKVTIHHPKKTKKNTEIDKTDTSNDAPLKAQPKAKEVGGRKGLEPTRYGDWESKGRCVDF